MSQQLSYQRRFFKRVFTETTAFTRNKLLIGALVGILARIGLLEFGRFKLWQEFLTDVGIFIASYVTVVVGAFIVNMIRVPALLDAECQHEISRLTSALEFPDTVLADHVRSLLVACRSEFVTADAAGGVGVFPLDRPSIGGVGVDVAAKFAS